MRVPRYLNANLILAVFAVALCSCAGTPSSAGRDEGEVEALLRELQALEPAPRPLSHPPASVTRRKNAAPKDAGSDTAAGARTAGPAEYAPVLQMD